MKACRLTYIGGPTLLIETAGVRILTDPTFDPAGGDYPPFLHKVMGPAISPEAVDDVDLVLLSHDQHADNFDTAGRRFLSRAKRVITTDPGALRLGGGAIGLDPWKNVEIGCPDGQKLRITATPARHGPPGIEPLSGKVIGFILELPGPEFGMIYISGDTVFYSGVKEIAERFSPDIAVLHLGDAHITARGPGRLTMNAEEGVQTAGVLKPQLIIPVHYEGWAHFREPKAEAQKVFNQAGLEKQTHWLAAGVPTDV